MHLKEIFGFVHKIVSLYIFKLKWLEKPWKLDLSWEMLIEWSWKIEFVDIQDYYYIDFFYSSNQMN